jgi:hypothetical protein
MAISEDLTYTRIIYRFPTPGNRSNPFGQPVRLITESFDSIGDSGVSNSAASRDYMIVSVAPYTSWSVGNTDFAYLYGGYREWQEITAVLGGIERKYIGFKQTGGRVSPAQLNLLRQIVEGVGDAFESVGGGIKSTVLYVLSLISPDGQVRGLQNQPIPSHHTGIIRMDGRLKGISSEGGAIDGNSVTMANTDVSWSQEIMTPDYHQYMQARHIWNDFLLLSSNERREQLELFRGYLKQRETLLERRRNGQIRVGDAFPPDPLSGGDVHQYIWWAWQRRLDPTAPPPDTRKYPYPGYDYNVKRSWWIAPTNGLPTN